jgi:hypothetical protein
MDTAAQSYSLFVDGQFVGSTPGPGTTATGSLHLGRSAWNSRAFRGSIDEVRIYFGALSRYWIGRAFSANLWPTPAPIAPQIVLALHLSFANRTFADSSKWGLFSNFWLYNVSAANFKEEQACRVSF